MTITTSSQAWSILQRHAQEIEALRLLELCSDNDRVSSLVAVYNSTFIEQEWTLEQSDGQRMLLADLSRQRMTLETMNHLLKLATARDLKGFITRLAWGRDKPITTTTTTIVDDPSLKAHSQSMHLALRVPPGHKMFLNGTNILTSIHREWDRMERLSESIRRGKLRGVTGSMIRDVVVVGSGTPVAALRFVYTALLRDERAVLASRFGLVEAASSRIRRNLTGNTSSSAARSLKFLSTIDPVAAAALVAELDPATTLVISIALIGNEETGIATKTLKSWLLHTLGNNRRADHILSKHMLLITGNDHIASIINKPESVLIVPEHSRCEPFTTFSAAGLLPLSIVFGWSFTREFIAGAHDIDVHFVETNPRHNLPVLLALVDVWNDTLLGSSSRIITPFTEAFGKYPAFVGALESQVCSRSTTERSYSGRSGDGSSIIVDGGLEGSFDRAFFQAFSVMNNEIVMTMDTQITFNTSRIFGAEGLDDVQSAQDALFCSLFAHADELAFGNRPLPVNAVAGPSSPVQNPPNAHDSLEGNRPSLLLMTGKLDAFACGQLIALAEHRAIVKAHIWEIDPFVRETGSSLRLHRSEQLRDDLRDLLVYGVDEDEDEQDESGDKRMNLSTKTLLRHYATLARGQRLR